MKTRHIIAGLLALLVPLLVTRPHYRGARVVATASDWHRVVCARTARVLRIATNNFPSHGNGYNQHYLSPRQWRLDTTRGPLRFEPDRIGACTPMLDGIRTPEQVAAGNRPARFGPDGRIVVPEVRLDAAPEHDETVIEVCWYRPDGSRAHCLPFRVVDLGA